MPADGDDDGLPGRPRRRGGALDPDRERPTTWELPLDLGTLVYEPNTCILAAHCPHGGKYGQHGPNACRLNRKTTASTAKSRSWQGRSIGLLVAWLRANDNHEFEDRNTHFNIVSADPVHEAVTFEARVAARELLMASGLANLDALLAVERAQAADEGPEPLISK